MPFAKHPEHALREHTSLPQRRLCGAGNVGLWLMTVFRSQKHRFSATCSRALLVEFCRIDKFHRAEFFVAQRKLR